MSASIFSDPEAFEDYFTRTAERLQARWEERVRFIRSSLERLQSLRRAAEAVQDSELATDIGAKLKAAEQELADLEAAPVTAAPEPAGG